MIVFTKKGAMKKIWKGVSLGSLPKKFRKDREVNLAAVRENARAIEYVSEELKKDKKFVLEAVMQNLWAIEYVSEELKKDKEVFGVAKETFLSYIRGNQFGLGSGDWFADLPEIIRDDKDIALEAVRNNGYVLKYVPEKLKDDDVILAAIRSERFKESKYSPEDILKNCSEFKNNKKLVLEAIKENFSVFESRLISEELKKDKNIISQAIRYSRYDIELSNAISYLKGLKEKELLNKELVDVMAQKIYENPRIYKELPVSYFKEENKEVLKNFNYAVKQSLADRVKGNVTKADEDYANEMMTMVTEKIAQEKAVINSKSKYENALEEKFGSL